MDNVNGTLVPRYLIYDVIQFRGNETGKCDFRIRLNCIRVSEQTHKQSTVPTVAITCHAHD